MNRLVVREIYTITKAFHYIRVQYIRRRYNIRRRLCLVAEIIIVERVNETGFKDRVIFAFSRHSDASGISKKRERDCACNSAGLGQGSVNHPSIVGRYSSREVKEPRQNLKHILHIYPIIKPIIQFSANATLLPPPKKKSSPLCASFWVIEVTAASTFGNDQY